MSLAALSEDHVLQTEADPYVRPSTKRGRPRDVDLTRRLLHHAAELIVAGGVDGLTAETLAQATGAGKASIYRRWPGGMPDVLVDLVGASRVMPAAEPGTTPASQVHALVVGWSLPPTRDEQVVAGTLGLLATRSPVGRCVRARLDHDLTSWWRSLTRSAGNPPDSGTPAAPLLLRAMLVLRLRSGPLAADASAVLANQLLASASGSRSASPSHRPAERR